MPDIAVAPGSVAGSAVVVSSLGSKESTAAISRNPEGNAACGDPPAINNVVLRRYQAIDVDMMRRAYADGARRLCYQLPTGGGKTIAFAWIVASAVGRGKRVLILSHRQEIADQISEALADMAVDHGRIEPGHPSTQASVQVASVATLIRRLDRKVELFDLIVIDECHHAAAASWRRIFAAYPDAKLLGVTATPTRLDGKGLRDIFDHLVMGPDVSSLTRGRFLVPAVTFTPAKLPDLSAIKTRAGDYATDQLAIRMSGTGIIAAAVRDYELRCQRVPAVAFGVDRSHSEKIAKAFRDAGFRAVHVDGDTPKDERRRMIAALGSGDLDVLSNCGLISEGVDVPAIGAAVLLRPTKSLALHMQQVGRALRPAPGKHVATILDHAGNCLRHGLPDEPRRWSLDPPKAKAPPRYNLHRCAACGAVNRPAPRCAHCDAPPKPTRPDQLEAWHELVRSAGLAGELRRKSYRELLQWADTPERARLAEVACGFKPGWAWHRAREIAAGGDA